MCVRGGSVSSEFLNAFETYRDYHYIAVADVPKIPSLVYDLLARIIPGAYGVTAASVALDINAAFILRRTIGPSKAADESAIVLLVFLLLLAYITGLALSLIGDGLQTALTRLAPSRFVLLDEFRADQSRQPQSLRKRLAAVVDSEFPDGMAKVTPPFFENLIILWYDQLRRRTDDLPSRLTRQRADYRMYGGLAAASFAAAILHGVKSWAGNTPIQWLFFGVSIAAGLLFTWGLVRSYRYFQRCIVNYYCGPNAE